MQPVTAALKSAHQYIHERSWLRLIWSITIILGFGIILYSIAPPASAENGFFQQATVNGLLSFGARILFGISNLFIGLAIFFLQFFIGLAGYNGFSTTPIVQIGWTLVRDIANMIFIVALLVIAFAQILGREEYALKKTMGKLVLMAILVNFSLLISQVIIDVAHVVTMTFLNAVVATAGGNLIAMFKFGEMEQVISNVKGAEADDPIGLQLFLTGVLAIFMSIAAMITIGVYCIIMLYRVVLLWMLLVMSPMTYAFSSLPATQKNAQEWWDEFVPNVMSAPLMVFFLWLTFATLGSGTIITEITSGENNSLSGRGEFGSGTDAYLSNQNVGLGDQNVTLSGASTWENMSSFAVAIALLWAGIDRVQKLGVRGADTLNKAKDFGKKAALIASGALAVGWGARQAGRGAVKAGKFAAYEMPGIGGKAWGYRGKSISGGLKGWWTEKGYETTEHGDNLAKELTNLHQARQIMDDDEQRKLMEDRLEKTREEGQKLSNDDSLGPKQKELALKENKAEQERLQGILQNADIKSRTALDLEIEHKEKEAAKEMKKAGGPLGKFARMQVALEKQASKTEKQAETRKQLLWKQTGSEAGARFFRYGTDTETGKGKFLINFGMGGRGIGFGDKRILGDKNYYSKDPQDRIEEGKLQAEQERSKAKDYEWHTKARLEALNMPRLKFTPGGSFRYQAEKGTMLQQITAHNIMGQAYTDAIQRSTITAQEGLMDQTRKMIEKIDTKPEMKKLNEEIARLTNETSDVGQIGEILRGLGIKIDKFDAASDDEKVTLAEELQNSGTFKKLLAESDALESLGFGDQLDTLKDGSALDAVQTLRSLKVSVDEKSKSTTSELGDTLRKRADITTNELEKMADSGKAKMWFAAKQQSEKEFEELLYSGKKQQMVDDAAQRHIWDQRGVMTPNSAEEKVAEKFAAMFGEMNFEAAQTGLIGHLAAVEGMKQNGTYDARRERSISLGLYKKLRANSWDDDAIVPIMEQMKDVYGKEVQRAMRRAAESGVRAQAEAIGKAFDPRALASIVNETLADDAVSLLNQLKHDTNKGSAKSILTQKLGGTRFNTSTAIQNSAGLSSNNGDELAALLANLTPAQIESLLKHL